MTIKQLEVFSAIAKSGNVTQAANAANLTQSACSMALSALETQLDGVLFDRHGKKLLLNARGKVLLPKVVNILSQLTEIQDLMLNKQNAALAGQLTIGASTTIGNYLLPKMLANFILAYPLIKPILAIANTEQIIQKILNFEIDIGMIEGNCYSTEIEVIPWKKDDLIIVAAPQHTFAKKRKLTLRALHETHWILRESGSGTRQKFDEVTQGNIKPFLELGNTEAIKQAVLAGIGIACISKVAVADLLESKRLIELTVPDLKLSRDFYILLHKDKYQSILLNRFMQYCKLI